MIDSKALDRVLLGLMSLAAEAQIRSNDYTPGFVLWRVLAEGVYGAVMTAVGDSLPDDEFLKLADEADLIAIRRLADAIDETTTVPTVVIPEQRNEPTPVIQLAD